MLMAAEHTKPGALQSRSFTVSQQELTPIEQSVMDFCKRAAAEGRPLESADTIAAAIGATGVSTVAGIMKRLEQKGYITRQIFQRGRVVCIAETGQCSLPPNDTSPHWRLRTENVPAPAIQAVRERAPSVMVMVEKYAKLEGCDTQTMLHHFVYIGAHAYAAEKECE